MSAFLNAGYGNHCKNCQVVYKICLFAENNQIDVAPHDIGVGVSQVFPVVVGALDSDNKIFVIEQPELHVHPAVQCALGDLFIRQTKNERLFILETHM